MRAFNTNIAFSIMVVCTLLLGPESLSFGQKTILKTGQAYAMTGFSNIEQNTYNLLSERNFLNSYGLQAGGGMRLENGAGFEVLLGYNMQTWSFYDKTSSEFTNGQDIVQFKNKMNLVNLGLSVHKTLVVEGQQLLYGKLGFDVGFIKTGDSFNDLAGKGSYTVTSNYDNGFALSIAPEVGMFLRSDEKKEVSVFVNYKSGMNEYYRMAYNASYLTNNETYNISSKGNSFAIGLKYTFKSTRTKREKPEKPPKDVIAKKKKKKEKKEKKEKELKVDKDGIPKSLKDRKVEKSKSIYVSSTTIVFKVWDSGKEVDGDTISLNLNGEWVIENFGLTREQQEISTTINPDGKNFLMLYAINQGKFPPNTAAISVWDGVEEQKLELKSTLETCGALNIIYKPDK